MTEEYSGRLAGFANNAHEASDSTASTMNYSVSPEYQDYGMTGKTELRLYKKAHALMVEASDKSVILGSLARQSPQPRLYRAMEAQTHLGTFPPGA